MAPNLQGLNVLLPPTENPDSQNLLSNSYPDISAQLALWTHLPFESEESPISITGESSYMPKETEEDEEPQHLIPHSHVKNAAIHDGHVNIITGTALPSVQAPQHNLSQPPQIDIASLLSGFGVDYSHIFNQQQQQHQPQSQPPTISPSLAQLLLYSSQNNTSPPPTSSKAEPPSSTSLEEVSPPAKRARTRKNSVSTVDSPEEKAAQGVSASEDKRRRNTAASARFRLKKKEREAALEGKAKELEQRVNELERECEGLRRENGWLKGLVVGVTGAAQGSAIPSSSVKRGREDDA